MVKDDFCGMHKDLTHLRNWIKIAGSIPTYAMEKNQQRFMQKVHVAYQHEEWSYQDFPSYHICNPSLSTFPESEADKYNRMLVRWVTQC